jgi:hypothetical protein
VDKVELRWELDAKAAHHGLATFRQRHGMTVEDLYSLCWEKLTPIERIYCGSILEGAQ